MRIRNFGLAMAAIVTLGSMQAWGGDREIAQQIMQRLKSNRDSGALKDFTLDMKVDKGVVLFRGNVSQSQHKDLVLKAAEGIDGVANVVDELSVKAQAAVLEAAPVPVAGEFSLRQALAAQAEQIMAESQGTGQPDLIETTQLDVVPGEVRPTAAVELAAPVASKDQKIVSAVVAELGKAQQAGQLKGFGVDVKSEEGVVSLQGRASSEAQRNQILRIAESVPGVQRVRNAITIPQAAAKLPEPPVLDGVAIDAQPTSQQTQAPAPLVDPQLPSQLAPVAVDHVNRPARPNHGAPVAAAAAPVGVPAMAAPYRNQAMRTPAMTAAAQMGAPVLGQPVAMGGHAAVGAPRYDSPNLPNYAWPGYAAYPNYAAVTYPQQYSPSAWPYIGPFYPYPQVPMGWRRVSLEWKDGWWFLDFTDR